jgi:MoxR-like ATPase
VSDRRWVKTVWLLRVAAASEGRASVALWDLLLLPWLTAPMRRARPPSPTGWRHASACAKPFRRRA